MHCPKSPGEFTRGYFLNLKPCINCKTSDWRCISQDNLLKTSPKARFSCREHRPRRCSRVFWFQVLLHFFPSSLRWSVFVFRRPVQRGQTNSPILDVPDSLLAMPIQMLFWMVGPSTSRTGQVMRWWKSWGKDPSAKSYEPPGDAKTAPGRKQRFRGDVWGVGGSIAGAGANAFVSTCQRYSWHGPCVAAWQARPRHMLLFFWGGWYVLRGRLRHRTYEGLGSTTRPGEGDVWPPDHFSRPLLEGLDPAVRRGLDTNQTFTGRGSSILRAVETLFPSTK